MASQTPAPEFSLRSRLPPNAGRLPASIQNSKPLFTTMRRPHYQQEFLTESLDNTAMGSPSPARPMNGTSYRGGRPMRGTGLTAAFQRVSERNKNDENKDRFEANGRWTKELLATRPDITRHSITDSSIPSPKIATPRSRVQTPSPPRGRTSDLMFSPTSETTEASPPREFAEAYKQINDAEDLAAQEEEASMSDDIDGVMIDGKFIPKTQSSSRRSSRRRSPGADDAIILESPEKPAVETTQDSMPSLPSDLELAIAGPTRHQKDLHRLSLALGETKAFSKARRRPGITVAGLQRDSASPRSESRSENSNTSGSIFSDAALNIPHQWGRKARAGRTWVSSLKRSSITDENTPPPQAIPKETIAKSPTIGDWQAEASITPLPLAQEQDSLEHSPSPAPSKSSILSARDRVRKLAFGDDKPVFQPREQVRNGSRFPALDMIREREIQYLAKSAVTTSRLGELKQKRSLERVGSRSASVDPEMESINATRKDIEPSPISQSSQAVQHVVDEDVTDNPKIKSKNEEAVPQYSKRVNNDSTDEVFAPEKKKIEPVYDPTFELLKKIAPLLQTPAQIQATKKQAYLKTPLVTGAWIDTPLPTVKREPLVEDTKQDISKESIREIVKSAANRIEDDAEDLIDEEAQRQKLQQTAPKLPGSALAAIINRAKDKNSRGTTAQGDDTLQLDESTILSLEDLVASGEDSDDDSPAPTNPNKTQHKDNIRQKRHKLPPPQTTDSDSDSDSEEENNVALTTRLERLRTSIRDAKSGVGSLQRRINKLPPANTSASRSQSRSRSSSIAQSDCDEAGEFHDFIWPCEKCGHKSKNTNRSSPDTIINNTWTSDSSSILDWSWRPLQIYTPKLYFWPAKSSFPHLTTPGWITLLSILLLAIELFLQYASSSTFSAESAN